MSPGAQHTFRTADSLYRGIRGVLESARAGAYRAVNAAMVAAYWRVGQLIVEHEQGGRRRAAYGEAVLEDLSQKLTTDFGRGFDVRNLRYMRQFYVAFPVLGPRPGEAAPDGKRNAPRSEFPPRTLPLSWTHYRLLLSIENTAAREWYMNEAATQQWSTRQLERQIGVLYYERLLASRKQAPVKKEAQAKLSKLEPQQFVRDPYVLEFLDLNDYPALRESAV